MILGIIGGGASGMAAALTASENPDVRVLLLERQARVGRKLSATGNGRCNLTNIHVSGSHYHGDSPDFSACALERYPVDDTLAWFRGMGLFTVTEPSGKVYPYSDQANSVVDVLRFALERPNIQVLFGTEITRIRRREQGFLLEGGEQSIYCDRVIVACGGLAGTKLGGSMGGYKLLRNLGHRATRLRPTLVQLKSSWPGTASLKGVRCNCTARLLHDGKMMAESTGELQWTEYGLSGPVIFEISRDACQGRGRWSCRLDLMPGISEEQLLEELNRRRQSAARSAEDLLTGMLHNRLGRVLIQSLGIRGNRTLDTLEDWELDQVARMVHCFEVELTEPMGMDAAQVTAGGIVTDDFNRETMESRLVPGLFACGEVLDVDGDCGGFNLQWAWSSGRLAGFWGGKEEI